ncbi:hypothetical protein FACS1894204_11690 [Synergistales bacterium]|nr:hypothetical protein FACS1894204_11690 [Synergistales bacterium]
MLWQTDATPYAWLGKEVGAFALHAVIDDATGIVTGAVFTQNECSKGYSDAMQKGIEKYGVPLALYTDKHTIFRSPDEKPTIEQQLAGEDVEVPLSNFGKALLELNIEHIKANTPQAKGRIERLWETLQDRLPVELRLLGVKTMEEANKALPELIKKHNERYAVLSAEPLRAYRPIGKDINLNYVFAKRETRKVGRGSEISYKNATYVPKDDSVMFDARTLVEVRETVSGEVLLWYRSKGVALKKIARPVKSAAKYASPVQQLTPDTEKTEKESHKPAKNHPWRRSMNKKDTDENQINNTTPL